MGLVDRWAHVASWSPGLANAIVAAPGVSAIVKRAAGLSPERRIPRFARETFRAWFGGARAGGWLRAAPDDAGGGRRVILFADTFNNYFHPETARAAVGVIEAAGWRVEVPAARLCCGRPLYDYGMLDRAKRLLRAALRVLAPHARAGVPIVVLEPSCAAVFRDELRNLFPDDEDARAVAGQTLVLSEFLARRTGDWRAPALSGRALVHGHCHHRAVMRLDDELAVLRRLGLEIDVPEPGCCGMAGSFGFERDHYAISMQIAERALLPAVRRAAPDTLVIANGFSCREQIAQGAGRRPLHLADVIAAALGPPASSGPSGPAGLPGTEHP
jgi:Fe-S oxidoreductase